MIPAIEEFQSNFRHFQIEVKKKMTLCCEFPERLASSTKYRIHHISRSADKFNHHLMWEGILETLKCGIEEKCFASECDFHLTLATKNRMKQHIQR